MFVLQHPAISAALGGSTEAHDMITQVIAQAMLAGLDQVMLHEHGKNLFASPEKLEKMQQDLQMLNLEFDDDPMPLSGLFSQLVIVGDT